MAEKEFKRIEVTDPAHADVLNEKIVEPAMELAQKVNNVDQKGAAREAERATLDQYGHIQHGVIKTTIPSSEWTGTEAPYTNVVTIPEILDTDSPIIDVIAEDESVQEAWGLINRAITDTGLITFYASSVPTIDIPIQIKVVR